MMSTEGDLMVTLLQYSYIDLMLDVLGNHVYNNTCAYLTIVSV
jgi:hypothetical protein